MIVHAAPLIPSPAPLPAWVRWVAAALVGAWIFIMDLLCGADIRSAEAVGIFAGFSVWLMAAGIGRRA